MMRTIIGLLGVAALVLTGRIAGAQPPPPTPCDFVTGGGDIIPSGGTAKANFGIGGSCKAGGDGRTLWGHLEYIDHGFSTPTVKKLKVHWTDITGYFFCGDPDCLTFVDPPGQPTGTRLICGTARTNLPSPDDTVNWAAKVTDNAEPGKNRDTFMINVAGGSLSYTSGDKTLVGGNIQLHKPNNSTGFFSGMPDSSNCPAFPVTPPITCTSNADCPSGGSANGGQDCNTSTGTCCPVFAPVFDGPGFEGMCHGFD